MTKKSISSKKRLYILVGILAIASLGFRLINNFHLEQTSFLFIGLPALLTLLTIKYTNKPKSKMGVVIKTITLFLLMSSIILGEGVICIIMAAPLFYGVGALIVIAINYFNKEDSDKIPFLVFPLLVFLAQPIDNKNEIQSIETRMTINQKISFEAMQQEPDFIKNLPKLLKIGFPKPVSTKGSGIQIGDIRNIQFESQTKGIGTLSLQVVEKTELKMVFEIIQDDTHIDHWLSWKNVQVELVHTNENTTEIHWTSDYVCNLQPSWYFKPIEAYTVDLMNQHLIDAYFNSDINFNN